MVLTMRSVHSAQNALRGKTRLWQSASLPDVGNTYTCRPRTGSAEWAQAAFPEPGNLGNDPPPRSDPAGREFPATGGELRKKIPPGTGAGRNRRGPHR